MGTKISAFTDGTTANDTDKIPVARSGANRYITPAYLKARPRARADNSVAPFNNISVANNTDQVLVFDREVYDTDGMFTIGTPNRFTITTPGLYHISGQIEWANTNTTSYRRFMCRLNGSTFIAWLDDGQTSHPNRMQQMISFTYVLAAADYVQLVVRQASGGALNILQEDFYSPVFSIALLST
jgi:hypothetical protein